jgi:tetratricopeptide (TPR) repeat protein
MKHRLGMTRTQHPLGYRTLTLLCFLPAVWLATACLSSAQAPESASTTVSPAILAHFTVAEDAQRHKDLALAEREYRIVIARAPNFAPAYLNLGLIKQDKRRWQEAASLFGKAARLNPQLTGAQLFLGIDECLQGQADPAISHLKEALRQKPDLEDAYSWLATAQRMKGDREAEVETLRQGLRRYPRNVDMLYLLGHAYEALGRQVIDQLEKANPHSSYVEQWLGEDYANSGYLAAGLLHFEKAIAAEPKRPELHVEAGEVYLAAGNLPKAKAEFTIALTLNPHNLHAQVRLGETEMIAGDLKRALANWTQALSIDPERVERILGLQPVNPPSSRLNQLPTRFVADLQSAEASLRGETAPAARLAAAFIAAQEGHPASLPLIDFPTGSAPQKAVACTASNFKSWLQEGRFSTLSTCDRNSLQGNGSDSMRLRIGRALYEAGKPAEALVALETIPSDAMKNPAAFYWRAHCYKTLALQAYLKLFEVAPDSDRAHELLADLASLRHQDAEAIREYQLALTGNTTLPNLHYEIGHLYWKSYKTSEARQELSAELALNPRHVGALIDMGATYLYEHQPAKALNYLTSAEKLDPGNNDVHEFLGVAYLQLGRNREAEAELRKATDDDKDGKVHYQLGKVYQALGEKQEAEQMFAIAARLKLESEHQNEKRVAQLNAAAKALEQN